MLKISYTELSLMIYFKRLKYSYRVNQKTLLGRKPLNSFPMAEIFTEGSWKQ